LYHLSLFLFMTVRRIVISPKEVAALTGRSVSYARRLVRTIKQHTGKSRTDLLTVEEFCAYTQLSAEEVRRAMHPEK
jgi:hypothetical protein